MEADAFRNRDKTRAISRQHQTLEALATIGGYTAIYEARRSPWCS
jgi:hypothetical protein